MAWVKRDYKANLPTGIPTGFGVRKQDLDFRTNKQNLRKKDLLNERILETVLPPSFVIDSQMNIIQVINDVNTFLE